MRTLQRPRSKIINGELHGDALAASLLALISNLDHHGRAKTLSYQKKKKTAEISIKIYLYVLKVYFPAKYNYLLMCYIIKEFFFGSPPRINL